MVSYARDLKSAAAVTAVASAFIHWLQETWENPWVKESSVMTRLRNARDVLEKADSKLSWYYEKLDEKNPFQVFTHLFNDYFLPRYVF